MKPHPLKRFVRNSVLAASLPAVGGCWCSPPGSDCGKTTVVTFDGRSADGGMLVDGGLQEDGGIASAACDDICGRYVSSCELADAGLVSCTTFCVGGRAPPGMRELSGVNSSAGSWVARMAELEGAAVYAFSHLSDELSAHGLPQHAAHALTAAHQEVRHAQEVTRLALGLGYCPTARPVHATPLRSLEEVAIDNAGECCGRELLGSLINAHQAKTAANAKVRQTMAGIAADERSHADFSFELARALMPRLTLAQRRRVREAQEKTLVQIGGDTIPAAARKSLGLMDEEQLGATVRGLLEHSRLA